ncbi:MAG: hypothetical protein B5766_12465 [Candidatus Lumbricidophila eiseniae]|uniref:Uncharacterized protein n=1 Tax=Candidatus Lumbricidiphila eiseniae TaxID=1969409 RepID=A0A2A6FNK3_9MICO|nr:MAG: hypothetical protein B5766_12465 [Candidatus Lumbricidophila eiseniae]
MLQNVTRARPATPHLIAFTGEVTSFNVLVTSITVGWLRVMGGIFALNGAEGLINRGDSWGFASLA